MASTALEHPFSTGDSPNVGGTTRSQRARRIMVLSGRYAIGGVLRPIIATLLLPLYTAYLTPADYGALAMITLTAAFISQLIETPLVHTLQRFYYHPQYRERNDVFLFNWTCAAIVGIGAVALLYLGAANVLSQLIFGTDEYLSVVRTYSIVLVLVISSNLLGAYVLLVERATLYNLSVLGQTVVAAAVTAYLIVWQEAGLLAVLFGTASGAAFSIAMWLPLICSRARPRLSADCLAPLLHFGSATVGSGMALLVLEMSDRYVLEAFRDLREVGLYTLGCSMAAIMPSLFTIPISNGIWPTIRKLEEQPSEQRQFIRLAATRVFLAGGFLCLGLSLFAREALALLTSGDQYAAAWRIVPLVAFGHLLHLLSRFSQAGIFLGNRPGWVSVSVTAAAMAKIGLALLLVPYLGALGAALATLVALTAWNVLNFLLSARFYQLEFDLARLAGGLSLAGILAVGAFLQLPAMPLCLLLAIKCGLLALYPVVIYFSGMLTELERAYLLDTARHLRARGPLQLIRGLV